MDDEEALSGAPTGRRRVVTGIVAVAVVAAAFGVYFLFGRGGAPRAEETPVEKGPDPAPAPGPPKTPAAPALGAAMGEEPAMGPVEERAKTGAVVVTVTGSGGEPLAGAKVGVFAKEGGPWRAETDAKGKARFVSLPPGTFDVRADAEGYAGEEKEDVEIDEGDGFELGIELEEGTAFDGKVVDVRDGKGIAGVRIVVGAHGSVGGFVSMSSRAPYDRTRSDAEGKFHVRGVPEANVATVEASAEGYTDAVFSVRILSGAVTPSPVLVKMSPGGRVTGVVVDPEGKPVAGATVFVMPASAEALRKNPRVASWSTNGGHSEAATAQTDAKGAYAASGLPLDDEYVAVAEADGFARSTEATGMRLHLQRLEATADLALRKPARLVVRLVDLGGSPVLEPAQVQVGEFIGGERKTAPDERNEYSFEGLNVGETTVYVIAPSFRPGTATATLEPGAGTDLVVRLDPGAVLEGVVAGDDGKPVAGATVTAGPRKENANRVDTESGTWLVSSREAKTDAEGRFRVPGLEPGECLLAAEIYERPGGTWSRTLAFAGAKAPAKELRLVLARLGSASIRVLAPDGAPFAGRANVLHARHGQGRGGSSTDLEDGRIRLDDLREGEVDLEIQVEGYARILKTFAAGLRRHVDLGDVRLDAGVELAGRVLDLAGNPVPGARVSAEGSDEASVADASGRFRLGHLPRGAPVEVEAESEGFLPTKVSAEGGRAEVELRLARGAAVRTTLTDAAGKAVREANLVAEWIGPEGGKKPEDEKEWESTDDKGRAKWHLPAGRWRFSLDPAEGGPIPLAEATLVEGESKDLDLAVPKR